MMKTNNTSLKYTSAAYSTVVFITTLLIIWGWRSVATNTASEEQANNIGAVNTWNCGDSGGNVIATMIDAKTLIIRGTGKMYDYESEEALPRYNINKDSITNVVIEQGVTSIGNNAFMGLIYLTSVTIPNSVKRIGNNAFDNCVNLTSIIINNRRPPGVDCLGAFGSFFGEPDMATYRAKRKLYLSKACLYVPSNSIPAYRADKGWDQFKCIKPIESAPGGGR